MDHRDLPGFVRSGEDEIDGNSGIDPPAKRPRFEVPSLPFSDIIMNDSDAESESMNCDAESVSTDGDGDGDGDSAYSEERTRPETYDWYARECAQARVLAKDIERFLERIDEAYNLRNEETAKGTDFFEGLETYRKELLESQDYLLNPRDSEYVAWMDHEVLYGWAMELESVTSQAHAIMDECDSLLKRAPNLREGVRYAPEPCDNNETPLQSMLRYIRRYWKIRD